ncbi:MAG: hypothetical protein H0T62_14155 [Parachlamydiaceae bacterium]|nr:hypothetical protein [Parachlamydiaceae bacterium]
MEGASNGVHSGTLPRQEEWTFDSAKEAMENKPYQTLESALNTIAILGVVIAGGLVIGALIQFSATLLAPAVFVLITAAALKYIAYKLVQSVDEGLVLQGLTNQKKAELFAARFKEIITSATEMDVKFINALEDDLGIRTPFHNFLQVRFDPRKEEIAQFSVCNDELSDDIVDDLLLTAYNKGVILHFSNLEESFYSFSKSLEESKPMYDEFLRKWGILGFRDRVVPEANLSALISARFVSNCFKTGDVQVDKMNQQLNALGFKYFKKGSLDEVHDDAKAVKPAIFMENEDTLIIRSLFGEVGNLKDFLALLNVNESCIEGLNIKTVKVQGEGFFISQRKCLSDNLEQEKSALEKEIKEKNHGVEIIFEELKIPYNHFWQEETPRYTSIKPSMEERLDYLEANEPKGDSNQEI